MDSKTQKTPRKSDSLHGHSDSEKLANTSAASCVPKEDDKVPDNVGDESSSHHVQGAPSFRVVESSVDVSKETRATDLLKDVNDNNSGENTNSENSVQTSSRATTRQGSQVNKQDDGPNPDPPGIRSKEDRDQFNCSISGAIPSMELPDKKNMMEGHVNSSGKDLRVSDINEHALKVSPMLNTQGGDASTSEKTSATSFSRGEHTEAQHISSAQNASVPSQKQAPQDVPLKIPEVSKEKVVRRRNKGSTEGKRGKSPGKATGDGSSRKRRVKDTGLAGQTSTGGRPNIPAPKPPVTSGLVQSNKKDHPVQLEYVTSKRVGGPVSTTATLPNLNTSAFPQKFFQLPFTDLQQEQLRAQIFVYGAFIAKVVPEEAHMKSAFGGPDGGRTFWEHTWRTYRDKLRSQKADLGSLLSPLQSHPGVAASHQANKEGIMNMKFTSSTDQTSCKGTPIANLTASSDWSIPNPAVGALGLGPTAKEAVGAVQLTPFREPPMSLSSGMIHAHPTVGVPTSISASPHAKNVTGSLGQPSADPKPRKRGRVPKSKDLGQRNLQPLSQVDLVSVPAVNNEQLESVFPVTATGSLSRTAIKRQNVFASPPLLDDKSKADEPGKKNISLSEETLGKLKDAKQQADDAAAFASVAVRHNQEIWSQLDKHNSSELTPEVEVKLTSAAIAVATAASVAKVAAAAASVASNAALQAKLIADEALMYNKCSPLVSSQEQASYDALNLMGRANPASITKVNGKTNNSSPTLFPGNESAGKRIESVSATSMQDENLNAVIKAAKLAVEAIMQAGKVVAMENPPPLSKLVGAGPDGFWKIPDGSDHGEACNETRLQLNINTASPDVSRKVTSENAETSGRRNTSGSVANGEQVFRRKKGQKASNFSSGNPATNLGLESTKISGQNKPEEEGVIIREGSITEGHNMQVDISQEERENLDNTGTEGVGQPESNDVMELRKCQGSKLLDLTSEETIKNDTNETTKIVSETSKTAESSLQKGAGVPRPGRKRKFMEVSKHYVGEQSTMTDDVNDSLKLVDYLKPQITRSRSHKKAVKGDAEEKRREESNPKSLKFGRPKDFSGSPISAKSNVTAADSVTTEEALTNKLKDSTNHVENKPERDKLGTEGQISGDEGLAASASETNFSQKAKPKKGKVAVHGRHTEMQEKVSDNAPSELMSGSIERRRSNRRIQPTSKLLEGMESAFAPSILPSALHDKGHRNQKKSAAEGINYS